MVVPISIGACWNPINPIHSGWGILIQCLFFWVYGGVSSTPTLSVLKVKSAAFPIRTNVSLEKLIRWIISWKIPQPRYEFPIQKISSFRWIWDFPSPPSYSPAIQEEKPPLFDANGIPGAPWHSESGARPMGRTRSPNRWVETNPWIFFWGYKRLK